MSQQQNNIRKNQASTRTHLNFHVTNIETKYHICMSMYILFYFVLWFNSGEREGRR
jgi:hypothetical protein